MDALTPDDDPELKFTPMVSLPYARRNAGPGHFRFGCTSWPTLSPIPDARHHQVSLFSSRIFRTFRLQTPLTFPIALFGFQRSGFTAWPVGAVSWGHTPRGAVVVTWASPPYRRLAKVTGRIEFTSVADGSFASGCSPPRLAATQLPPATKGQTSFRRGLTPRWFVNSHRRT
jgi:hypothetical protein